MIHLTSDSNAPQRLQAQISPDEWETRVQLAAAYRAMALAGFTDFVYNHLSARVPGSPQSVLIKSEHQAFEEVTASSLLTYDLDGRKLQGAGQVSQAGLVIHLGVLAGRPDLQAVFHTHTPANMAVSAQRCGLLPITQHAVRFFGRIGYHPFTGFEFDAEGRSRLLASLGPHLLMLLENHGALVGGRSIQEAYIKHYFLEMACRAQVGALSGGLDNVRVIDAEVAEFSARQLEGRPVPDRQHKDWQALLRQLAAGAPDYLL